MSDTDTILRNTMKVLEQAQRVCGMGSGYTGIAPFRDLGSVYNMEHALSPDLEPTPIQFMNKGNGCPSRSIEPRRSSMNGSSFMDDPFHRLMMNVSPVEEMAPHSDLTPIPVPELATSSAPPMQPKPTQPTRAAPVFKRTRKLQPGQWNDRVQDLLAFEQKYGHMYVPNNFKENPHLSQWVKRQRYQRKIKMAGKHSTLNDEREALLTKIGFIWDSHSAFWNERLQDLKKFQQAHGHCNVPPSYQDTSLSLWVKHQRRQYNRAKKRESTTLTEERYAALNTIGFDWNPRNLRQH
ncbi:MAG: hypothetical protein SGILL_008241 [Bacillariaceae sp.]